MNKHEYLFYTDLIKKDKEELIELIQSYNIKIYDIQLAHEKEMLQLELDNNKLISGLKCEISRLESQLKELVKEV